MADPPKTELIDVAQMTGDETPVTFIVNSGGTERRYPMRRATMSMGRSDQMDIVVKDPSVSSRHLEFRKDGGSLRLKDLGSSNGTYLGDERITDVELRDGDMLRVGATVIVTIEVGPAPSPRRRPPAPRPAPVEEFEEMRASPPRPRRPPVPAPPPVAAPAPRAGRSPLVTGIVAGAAALLLVVGAVAVYVHVSGRRAEERKAADEVVKAVGAVTAQSPCGVVQESVAAAAQLDKTPGVEAPTLPASRRLSSGYQRFIEVQRDKAKAYGRMAGTIEQFVQASQPAIDNLKSAAARVRDEPLRTKVDELLALVEERQGLAGEFTGGWRRLQTETNRYADLVESVFVRGAGDQTAFSEWRWTRQPPQILNACRRSYDARKKDIDDKLDEVKAARPQ